MAESSLSLCRICLEDGATLPIFEITGCDNSVYSKLCLCLSETIEDTVGYPRNICNLCNITLNAVYKFIKKYKKSCETLQRGLQTMVKQEVEEYSDSNDLPELECEFKIQPKIEFTDAENFMELVKPLKLKLCNVKTERKGKISKKRVKTEKCLKNKSNRIASSILEGEFVWTGETWCTSSKTLPPVKKEIKKGEQNQKRISKLEKIPKQKKLLAPEFRLCDLCGEVCKNQDRLNTHISRMHLDNIARKCPTCSKTCASEYYLNRHIKRMHSNLDKNFVCATCGRAFMFNADLRNHHRAVHDKHLIKKKEYRCKICNKNYACPKSVIVHERSVHTGERPAVCSVCGSRFYHNDYLKDHMRLHTGETPFKCPVCGRGYAQRCNMKSHIRIHRIADLDPELLSKIRPNYLKLMKV